MREVGPGRPREFDEAEALEQIMHVFWAKGFEGASLADLMAATGLQKGSLYAAFGDKRALYLKALAHYDQTEIERAVRVLSGTGTARARIGAFLRAAVDPVKSGDERGCFLCNSCVDQAALDEQSREASQAGLARLERALERALADAPTMSGDRARRRAEARHLLSVYIGLRSLAKSGAALSLLEDVRRRALQGLDD